MTDKIKYWLDIAEEDISVAKVLIKANKFLYTGFMCHQAIEKALKAVISRDCEESEIPPKIHDLSKLAIRAKLFDLMSEEQQDFIEDLNPLNVEARYPEYKDEIAAGLNNGICREFLMGTEALLCWIKEQLSTRLKDTPK